MRWLLLIAVFAQPSYAAKDQGSCDYWLMQLGHIEVLEEQLRAEMEEPRRSTYGHEERARQLLGTIRSIRDQIERENEDDSWYTPGDMRNDNDGD